MKRKRMSLKEITTPASLDCTVKAIQTTTSSENICELQELLKPFGIQISVFEEEFSWSRAKVIVFTIPSRKGE